ncbi:cupin domain-containing protein [Rubrivirga sp. IMCC43871]|uniref:cupin domain-containing protein n=1 Tax=Rubrivirga sp. IMCC43871 TaxID=3391575 RepID=UPI0039903610
MTLPSATPQSLATLAPVETGRVATRVLHKTAAGSASVLAMAAGEGLREHTNATDALVVVIAGEARISVAGEPHAVRAGETTRLPATVPHAVEAVSDLRMLLILLHES